MGFIWREGKSFVANHGERIALTKVTYVLPFGMIKVREYLSAGGTSPFALWFKKLDPQAASRVASAIYRIEQGNFSSVKGVGSGVFEYRIDMGAGYRIYFGKDGETLVILLGGGTKRRQSRDIESALICWKDYKQRKEEF